MKTPILITLILSLILLTGCRDLPLIIEDSDFFKKGNKIAVVPATENPIDIMLADQVRMYVAVNTWYKVLAKEPTERLTLGKTYDIGKDDLVQGFHFKQNIKKASFKKITMDYIIVCENLRISEIVTKTTTTYKDQHGDYAGKSRSTSKTKKMNMQIKIYTSSIKKISTYKLEKRVSTVFPGSLLTPPYALRSRRAMAAIIDKASNLYVKKLLVQLYPEK